MKKLLLANFAIARGAYEAGAKVISSYPGTPSTEITEAAAKYNEIYCEWAPNEKAALEVAFGLSVAGVRAMACMKHVGLNVAADPLFTAAYTGINGGLVVVVADDPAMHSSQNEQDSRYYAMSAHIPMLEPADSAEAKEFTRLAFELSEKYDTPVLLRLTTRIAHSQSMVEEGARAEFADKAYSKNPKKYVMMPLMARERHLFVEAREKQLAHDVNKIAINRTEIRGKKLGIVCAGAVYQYAKEATDASIFKLGVVYPLPIESIREFAKKVDELIVVEELEPIIENQLKAAGIACRGKDIFGIQGELSTLALKEKLSGTLQKGATQQIPSLPSRPPVMCAGCPHRGVFYVLKKLNLTVSGDIGCYTLGALPPLAAIDLCVCMGASVSMAHGFDKAVLGNAKKTVAVIGDSTFVHTGINGLINAVYNKGNLTLLILDNSTTGMTGHQDNPATGVTLKEEKTHKLDIAALCKACGAGAVREVDAYDLAAVERAVQEETAREAVSVIIVKRPCVLLSKTHGAARAISACKKCKACLKIGCPAIESVDGGARINKELCVACGVCVGLCKFGCIK